MRNLIITTLILLFIGTLVLFWDQPPEVFREKQADTVEVELPTADGYMLNTETFQHDKSGHISYNLKTDQIRYFASGQRFEMDKPKIVAIDIDNPDKPWHLDANNGEIARGGEKITLTDNVYARQKVTPQGKNELLTSQLIYLPDQNTLKSERQVTIITPQGKTRGVGMKANLKQEHYELLSEVKGTHRVSP